jgi:hypothetical protein
MRALSRRQFGAGMLAVGWAAGIGRAALAGQGGCGASFPAWATQLGADLEGMASRLRAHLKPWSGPERIARPEGFGFSRGQPLATHAIQSAIDSLAQQGGGTVVLAHGDYVSGTLDLRSHIRLPVEKTPACSPASTSRIIRPGLPSVRPSWTATWA